MTDLTAPTCLRTLGSQLLTQAVSMALLAGFTTAVAYADDDADSSDAPESVVVTARHGHGAKRQE